MASRVHRYLVNTIPEIPYEYTLWTNSLVTLTWIQSDHSMWKTFVTNRVTKIQRETDLSRWRYCPGSDNPADLLTGGIAKSRLVSSDVQWSRPMWLTELENEWPDLRSKNEKADLLKEQRKAVHVIQQRTPPEPLLDLTRYSELHRDLRVTAQCMIFEEILKWQTFRWITECRGNSWGQTILNQQRSEQYLPRQDKKPLG